MIWGAGDEHAFPRAFIIHNPLWLSLCFDFSCPAGFVRSLEDAKE